MSDSEQKGKEIVATEATVYARDFYDEHKKKFEARPMVLGVGSGSTVAIFMAKLIEAIGSFLADQKISYIQCVPTSRQAEALILQHSHHQGKQVFQLSSLNANPLVDLLVDGADEVVITKEVPWMLKGGGGAMVMEAVVARASERQLYLITQGKISEGGLGQKGVPVPIEVLPDAYRYIQNQLRFHFPASTTTVRQAPGGKAGPVITDNGNMIVDLKLPHPFDPTVLAPVLDTLPGIVGHGIFLMIIDALYISDGTNIIRRAFRT